MVAWVRVAAVCGVALACGGRAQRAEPNEGGDASGGSSAGSPGEAAAGTGGTGAGGVAGSTTIPTAGNPGAAGSSSGSGGTSVWTGLGGAPAGEPSSTHECPQGTTTEYVGALPEVELRFRGTLNGEPVDLATDRMSAFGGCNGNIWTVELFFDGVFAGDQLTLYFDAREGCLAQAWYLPEGEDAEATTVRSELQLWSATERNPEDRLPQQAVYGALSIRAVAVDGRTTHELDGELTLHLEHNVCVG